MKKSEFTKKVEIRRIAENISDAIIFDPAIMDEDLSDIIELVIDELQTFLEAVYDKSY